MAEEGTATADGEDVEEQQANPEEKPARGKKWLWIVLAIIILAGGGGAATWFLVLAPEPVTEEGAEGEEAAVKGKPHYLQIDPGFVVNLNDPDFMRYLQVDVEIMTFDQAVLAKVEEVMPEIRNRLLFLFGQQKYEDLIPRSGKEALQEKAREDINKIMASHGMTETVSAVYFTSFVMQ